MTSPTVLPIDAPAPIPTISPYPMGIASFYYPGYVIEKASPTFDPTKPTKVWSRPLQPGENPNSLFGPVGYFQGITYMAGELFMSKQAAQDTNIVPASEVATPAQQEAFGLTVAGTQSIPIPARPPIIPQEAISEVMGGQVVITNSSVAGPSAPQSPQDMTNSESIATILANTTETLRIVKAAYPNLV